MLVAGAYSYNDRTSRLEGQRGALMPDGATRNLGSYFVDFILKYRGWAFYTDFMGRTCDKPLFDEDPAAYVYTGSGLNIQTSWLIKRKWGDRPAQLDPLPVGQYPPQSRIQHL